MRNIYWLASSFLVNGIFSVLVLSLLTRFISTADYAIYSMILTSAAILNSIFFQWIRIFALRNVPTAKYKSAIQMQTRIAKYLATNFLIFLFLFSITLIFMPTGETKTNILIILSLSVTLALYEIQMANVRAKGEVMSYSLLTGLRAVLYFSCCAALCYWSAPLYSYLILLSCIYLFVSVIPLKWNFLSFSVKNINKDKDKNKENIKSDILNVCLYPTISVASSLGLYLLFKYLTSLRVDIGIAGQVISKFDVYFLLFSTIFLLGNFIYQNDLIRAHEDNNFSYLFKKSHKILLFMMFSSVLGYVVFVNLFQQFVLGESFNKRIAEVDDLIALSCYLIFIKANWIDHAFYLTRKYKLLAISNVSTLLVFYGTFEIQDSLNKNLVSHNICMSLFFAGAFSILFSSLIINATVSKNLRIKQTIFFATIGALAIYY